jgi:hypothetical protein
MTSPDRRDVFLSMSKPSACSKAAMSHVTRSFISSESTLALSSAAASAPGNAGTPAPVTITASATAAANFSLVRPMAFLTFILRSMTRTVTTPMGACWRLQWTFSSYTISSDPRRYWRGHDHLHEGTVSREISWASLGKRPTDIAYLMISSARPHSTICEECLRTQYAVPNGCSFPHGTLAKQSRQGKRWQAPALTPTAASA